MEAVSHANWIQDVAGVLLHLNVCQGQTQTSNRINVEQIIHLNGL